MVLKYKACPLQRGSTSFINKPKGIQDALLVDAAKIEMKKVRNLNTHYAFFTPTYKEKYLPTIFPIDNMQILKYHRSLIFNFCDTNTAIPRICNSKLVNFETFG